MKRNFLKFSAVTTTLFLAFMANYVMAYNPYGDSHDLPCTATETELEDEFGCKVFVGMGHATGMLGEEGNIHEQALIQARRIVKQKLSRYVAGGYSNSCSSTSSNGRSRNNTVKDSFDEEAFEAYLNTVKEYCIKWHTDPGTNKTTCFISIVIPMDDLEDDGILSRRQEQKVREDLNRNNDRIRNKARRR